MLYDTLLLFGVLFGVTLALLASLRWSTPLTPSQRLALQLVLFASAGGYFVLCWARGGRTLAMKTWRLRVVDRDGRAPSWPRALARYLLAWHLPLAGLLLAWIFPAPGARMLIPAGAGLLIALAPLALDPERGLLHDRLLGTRVVRTGG